MKEFKRLRFFFSLIDKPNELVRKVTKKHLLFPVDFVGNMCVRTVAVNW